MSSSTEQQECQAFADFILRIGNGETTEEDDELLVELPKSMVHPQQSTLVDFIKWCFADFMTSSSSFLTSPSFVNDHQSGSSSAYEEPAIRLHERAILCPFNKDVDEINSIAIGMFQASATADAFAEFLSADSIYNNEDVGGHALSTCPEGVHEDDYCVHATNNDQEHPDSFMRSVPEELLNSINVSGVPPHKLFLKKDSPLLLLRNLDFQRGLCNGTRLRFVECKNYLMRCAFVDGPRQGTTVLLPRINFIVSNTHLPFNMLRRQYPVKLAFAMTINKAQGQSLKQNGLYLPRPVFSHGQLYVGLSRSGIPANTSVFIGSESGLTTNNDHMHKHNSNGSAVTQNIVWREALSSDDRS